MSPPGLDGGVESDILFAELVVPGEERLRLWVVDIEAKTWTTAYLHARPISVDDMREVNRLIMGIESASGPLNDSSDACRRRESAGA